MMLTALQERLLNHLIISGPATTGQIAVTLCVRVDQVSASLNSLCTQPGAPLRHERIPKSAQYVTWFYTAATEQATKPINEESPVSTLQLTQLQERLVANILARNHGDARSDVLGKACDVAPGQVSASLLTLRAQGYIGSANDGGDYNFWFVTPKLREALDQRLAEQRRADAARKQEALREEGRRAAEATKQRLLAQRGAREKINFPTRASPVTRALDAAMLSKGRNPLHRPKYILWSPSASTPPQVQYATRAEADRVAKSMAARCSGQVFIVCELLDARCVVDIPAQQQQLEVVL